MKRVLKITLYFLVIIAMIFLVLIITATLSDYRPREKETIYQSEAPQIVPTWTELDFIIWNIGYGGLDKDMDFFYDGGNQVRTSEEKVIDNMKNIRKFLTDNDTVEFILLQEVDIDAHRSYGFNEYDSIKESLDTYWSSFAKNYDVFFVPLPFTQPMGPVQSGLLTQSKPRPESSVRMRFPGNYAWPKRLFMLDRCFLVNRYFLNNNKELLVINTHNSAYDDGSLRKAQMEYLRNFLLQEYTRGNYIVVGGDWNQCPPGFLPNYGEDRFDDLNYSIIRDDYLPATWQWAFPEKIPTNRRLAEPYSRGTTPATTIDFYLLSPNIKLMDVFACDFAFANSDHQPVLAKIKLMN